jgi:hypothetical protein
VEASKPRTTRRSDTADNSITARPAEPPPRIDSGKEAEQATADAIANTEKQSTYRNLSALSPEQRSWLRENQMKPAAPGIPWKYHRVEVTEGGFPIIHINDHCVAIPLMMFMVFCKVGHIEPQGDLFDHMRDPHNPWMEEAGRHQCKAKQTRTAVHQPKRLAEPVRKAID